MNHIFRIENELKAATTATRKANRAFHKGTFFKAIKMNQTSIITEYARNYIHLIDLQDKNGFTLLAYAVQMGREEIVDILLRNDANPNIQINQGQMTPLHLAVLKNHKKIQDLLVEAGADESIKDSQGNTPWEVKIGKLKSEK